MAQAWWIYFSKVFWFSFSHRLTLKVLQGPWGPRIFVSGLKEPGCSSCIEKSFLQVHWFYMISLKDITNVWEAEKPYRHNAFRNLHQSLFIVTYTNGHLADDIIVSQGSICSMWFTYVMSPFMLRTRNPVQLHEPRGLQSMHTADEN